MTQATMAVETYDISFQVDGEEQRSFMLYRAKGIPGWRLRRNRSIQAGSPLPGEDLPIDTSDLAAGAGHSHRWTPNVYEMTYPGDARDPRGVVPPSELEMIDLPGVTLFGGGWADAFELANVSTSVPADLFLLGDKYAFKWKTGSDHLASEFFFNDTPLSAAIYNGPAFVAVENGNIYRAPTSPTDVWTQSADFHARHLVKVSMVFGAGFGGDGSYKNALIADIDGNVIKWTTGNPMDAADWVPLAGVQVGQSYHAIRQLVEATEAFAVFKADGIWKIDGRGKARNLTPYWGRDTDAGYAGMCGQFNGAYVFGSHPRRYDMVPFTDERQESPHDATPGAWPVPNESILTGQITANTMLGTGELVAAMYNPTRDESSIWLGRMRAETGVEGVGPVLWHGAFQIVPGMVSLLHVSSLAPAGEPALPYLWMGTSTTESFSWHGTTKTAGLYLFRCRIARGQAPLRDPTYPFATAFWKDPNYAARIYYSMTDGGAQYTNVPKSTYAFEANLGGDPASSFATVATKVDTGDFVVQPEQLAAPRGYVLETQQDGQAVQHRVDLRGGTSEEPTILRGITEHLTVRPEQRREYEFWVQCGPTVETNTGSIGSMDADIDQAYLEYLQTVHDVTVTIGERTIRGKVMPGVSGEDISVPNTSGWQRVVSGVFVETMESLTWGDGHEWGKFP